MTSFYWFTDKEKLNEEKQVRKEHMYWFEKKKLKILHSSEWFAQEKCPHMYMYLIYFGNWG